MDDAYPVADGESRQRMIAVGPGQSTPIAWNLAASDHWYSLSLAAVEIPNYLRRFAGHAETGNISRTDPGIGLMRV